MKLFQIDKSGIDFIRFPKFLMIIGLIVDNKQDLRNELIKLIKQYELEEGIVRE